METQNIQPKLSPKFFFLSLGVLVTLIASVTSFLMLAFETLNKQFPDVLNAVFSYGYNTYNYEQLRGALATLIIIFPAFLILSYFWNKASLQTSLGKIDIIIRKWMIYIILFLSAVVLLVDLVTLVRYFISGEITIRFILKVLVALVTAVIVGSYFITKVRNKEPRMEGLGWIYGVIIAIISLGFICWSFGIMGSPMSQRLLRFDDRRMNDLQTIQWQVINYWQQKEKLPEKLEDLSNPLSGFSIPVDPEFQKGNVYEYNPIDKMSFELCATFSMPMPKGWSEYSGGIGRPMYDIMYVEKSVSYPYPGGGMNETWEHDAGRTCFSREIDKDLYPPFTQ